MRSFLCCSYSQIHLKATYQKKLFKRNSGILNLFGQTATKPKKNPVSIASSVLPATELTKTRANLLFSFFPQLLLFSFFFNQFECKFFINFWKFLKRGKQLINKLAFYTCNLHAVHCYNYCRKAP